jgi:glycosyltransferase involved in cell wall biosynthesis
MKLLVALSRFPWPIEKGDKLRAYYQLKGLAENHEVHLVCLNEGPVPEKDLRQLDFCKSIEVIPHSRTRVALNLAASVFNGKPFQVNYFRSARMKAAISELIRRESIDVVYVQLIRLGMNLPFDAPVGWFLDYMDAFSIGMEKRVRQSGALVRPFARIEARRLREYEAGLADKFDGWSIISERDAAALPHPIRQQMVIIPNGVGEMFFEAVERPKEPDFDLIFFGNMGYHPNVQSARYLVEEVLPALQEKGIKGKLCLAGARPAPLLQSYAGSDITVTGFVDDIRTWVMRARLAIAPLIAGQGLQNKLLESMAMGVPTLTTTLANSALGAEHGKEIVVCDSPEEFALAIRDLLSDPDRAAEIGAAGRRFVEEHFRWKAMNDKLSEALEACRKK